MQTKSNNQQQPQGNTWAGSQKFNGILIKKACEHTACSHFKCERKDLRYNGIEI